MAPLGLVTMAIRQFAADLMAGEAKSFAFDGVHREKRLKQMGGVLQTLNAIFRRREVPAPAVDTKEALAELLSSVPTRDEMNAALGVMQIDMSRRSRLQLRLLLAVAALQGATIITLLLR